MQSVSVNRIFANHQNAIRDAAIVVSAQRPSTDLRLLEQARSGGGKMLLGGSFTGAADSVIDVEVLTGTGGELTASAPVIRGVGNGTLSVSALAPSASPETLTVSLLDAGTAAKPAQLEFFGATLSARTPGAGSNALALNVTRNLTTTPLQYATLEPITAGAHEFDGPQWDWGQPPATDSGIPEAALRIQFDGFPTVHRAWKTWAEGRFVYHIDPPAPFAIPADTRILGVTGHYSLALSNGVVTETYTAVTVFEFLSQLEARSALATVRGAIAADRAPGGMAVTDIPLRTDAHALPATGGRIEVLSVAPDAPTENITLEWLGAGAGLFGVSGSVSGPLPSVAVGEHYTHGPVSFRVPAPAANTAGARISAVLSLTSRAEGEFPPAVCFKPLRLGAAATDKSVTFTYRARPPADCECQSMPALRLSDACLGLGGDDMSDLAPEHKARLIELYEWRAGFIATQTSISPPGAPVWSAQDMDLADRATAALATALAEIHESEDALDEWDSAFTQLQADCMPLDGVTGAVPVIADQLTLGTWLNPENGHVYDVTALSSESYDIDDPDSAVTQTYHTVPLSAAVPLGSAAWPTTGGTADVGVKGTVNVSTGHDYFISVTDLGAAKDLQHTLSTEELQQLVRKYEAKMDHCRTLAGIVPKSDAGTDAGACWRDVPEATHWWVDESGEYLPAFTNHPYVSVSRDADGKIYSTREFGIGIVTPCEHRLKDGDRITITIRGTGQVGYRQGDKIIIPVVAAQSAPFVGGSNGNPVQTWTVRGSVSGALPDWLYNPSAPAPYAPAESPAELTLLPGGIPFEVGDTIAVSFEGGTLRWRRDGGSWTTGNLYGVTHDLGDGLQLTAEPGAAPSFVAGDRWQFRAVATHGVSRLRQPRIGQAFAWDGAAVTLDADLGSVQPLEAVLLALHTLPGGCTVTISGGDAAVGEWSVVPGWHPSAVLAMLPAGTTARYLRVSVTGAGAGAAIGWLYAGHGWQPSVGASDLTLRRQYGLSRGQGLNPAALYRGRGTGGQWRWELDAGGALIGSNADALLRLIDHTAEQGMEPVCVVPDVRDPARAAVAIIDTDEVVFTEHNNWQASTIVAPVVSVELPFRAVIA